MCLWQVIIEFKVADWQLKQRGYDELIQSGPSGVFSKYFEYGGVVQVKHDARNKTKKFNRNQEGSHQEQIMG